MAIFPVWVSGRKELGWGAADLPPRHSHPRLHGYSFVAGAVAVEAGLRSPVQIEQASLVLARRTDLNNLWVVAAEGGVAEHDDCDAAGAAAVDASLGSPALRRSGKRAG